MARELRFTSVALTEEQEEEEEVTGHSGTGLDRKRGELRFPIGADFIFTIAGRITKRSKVSSDDAPPRFPTGRRHGGWIYLTWRLFTVITCKAV